MGRGFRAVRGHARRAAAARRGRAGRGRSGDGGPGGRGSRRGPYHRGDLLGGRVVIAAGVWSREVCASLGVRIEMAAGKGYSFSVPAESVPKRLVHPCSAKAVPAPLGKGVPVAGTMEFDRDPDRFRQGRVQALVAAARPYLPGAGWERREQEWMGPRPMTPDGLPLIGPVPGRPRILLATGHNMLDLMPAPAAGRLVAGLLTGEADPGLAARVRPVPIGPAAPGTGRGLSG
ncbi:NAD(P)/FAD-dependent oxidoreductase [Streptomyces sp. NPDC008343]|uniref:NAD(P)/FAD-dependent oxidoreductase n=1 Tax=Streptomyces sp. NPDC008343 TaxID=3364828 RepID=UPI0036E74C41